MSYKEKESEDAAKEQRDRKQDDRRQHDDDAEQFQRERMRSEIDEGHAEKRREESDFWSYC